ncbi:MAG: hypothetical protein ABI432_03020 [Flavobacteriales bacterium]
MRYRTPLLLTLFVLASAGVRAQGCSDAGACTAGPIGQLQLWTDSVPDQGWYDHNARAAFSYAIGEQGTIITQVMPELNIGFTRRFAVQLKVPYIWVHGDLGDNSGIGDLFVTSSYAFVNKTDQTLSGVVGMRLPTGEDNATVVSPMDAFTPTRSLPMPYQTGLGTADLIVGVSWRHKRYVAALAYQQVLTQDGNDNEFTHQAWNNEAPAVNYFESYNLRRGNDLVVRAQYAYGCGRLSLQPGLLAIYHLQDDSRLNDQIRTSQYPERIILTGSKGLTLNVTVDLRFKLADQWALEASFGAPVIAREVRPDGLTRENVTAFGIQYRF